MAAVPLNLTVEQGTDFEASITIRNRDGSPLNLLSYTGESKLRKHYSATTHYPFTLQFVDRANGRVKISMASTNTSALTEGRYVYDIVLTSPNSLKSRVVFGSIVVSPGVC